MRATLLAIVALASSVCAAGDVERLEGRGVYYVRGHVRCPLAGVGTRDADASNRIGIDDDAGQATVDHERHRIVFRNTKRYATRTIVGDVLLLGAGTTKTEGKVPFGVHLKIEKEGDRFLTSVHPHPTTRAHVIEADLEPFEVYVDDGKTETRVLTSEQAKKAIREPELAARVANLLLQVEDHTEGKAIAADLAGTRLVDLTIGYGAPGMNLKVARVEVVSMDPANAPLVARGALAEMLAHGSWELRLSPTLLPLPKSEFDRDLFLFGMDIPLLAPLKERGLLRNETLVIGWHDGKGYVALGDRRAPIERPDDVARAYLEYHLLGGIIARQIVTLPERIALRSPGARQ